MDGDDNQPPRPAGRARVFLHVGSPKTGSTFLQEVLWSHRDLVREQGLLLPLDSFFDHYLASVDVREMADQDRFPARAKGMWQRIVEEGLSWGGDVLVSHELFAGATAEQAAAAIAAWDGADVHVVVTARDLARQIPAEWQEHLKHRSCLSFAEFVDALRCHAPASEWFWTVQDAAGVCRRWGAPLPRASVHVVTVPGAGAPPSLLWKRFATLVGLDADAFDLSRSRSNASLRAPQAELLRRVNARLGDRLPIPGPYAAVVKDILAQQILAGRAGATLTLEPDSRSYAVTRSEQTVAELTALDVDVVGDLAELVPPLAGGAGSGATVEHTDALDDTELLGESVEALIGLMEKLDAERQRTAEAWQAVRRVEADLDYARTDVANLHDQHAETMSRLRSRPFHTYVIWESERRPRLMRLRVVYWHTVERMRRLARRTEPR